MAQNLLSFIGHVLLALYDKIQTPRYTVSMLQKVCAVEYTCNDPFC